ncbi:TonB-dependent receptor (plasmid) [Catenovulum sp. SX2]|uniref:TonB-dependent receptor n=1 Tax=Catenovulum sp. SX2 TaxID=3398614 RepID=UPI003F86658E
MKKYNKFGKSLLATSILAGIYAPNALSQQTEQAQADENTEVIQVRGFRGSAIKSLANKQFSNTVMDSITATDIGKLPDATIADSLQRIPGIQINRSAGEGNSPNIRGNSNVAVTLNGEQMMTAGAITVVQPSFTDIPATMVSGVDVFKSSQASILNGGVSGTINLKTYRPFELTQGLTLTGKAEAIKGSYGDETDKSLSLFTGFYNGDDFGATLNVSHSTVNLADYAVGASGSDWGFIANEKKSFVEDDTDASFDGDTNDLFYAFQGHEASNRFIERERNGLNGAIQWRLTDSVEVLADVFYTKMQEHQRQAGFIASQAWQGETGWFTPSMLDGELTGAIAHPIHTGAERTLVEEGNLYSLQAGELQARRTMVHSETHAIDKESLNTNLEIKFDNGGDLKASVRWVHGEAVEKKQHSVVDAYINNGCQANATYKSAEFLANEDAVCEDSPVNPWGYAGEAASLPDGTAVDGAYTQIPIGIAYQGDKQTWSLPEMQVVEADGSVTIEKFGSNINRYSATSTNLTGYNRNGEFDAFRLDANYYLDAFAITSVDFGARYGIRKVDQQEWTGLAVRTNGQGDPYVARWKDSASQAPTTGESYIEPISFNDSRLAGKITQIDDFVGAEGLGSLYFVDPKAMDDPLAFHTALYGTQIQAPNPDLTYELEEKTTSIYAQANLSTELANLPLRGNFGFRYVQTEIDVEQANVDSKARSLTFNNQDYLIGPGAPFKKDAPLISDNSYNDFLPSLNLTLNLTDEHLVRFSFNKTLGNHNTNDLGGGITVTRILGCNVQTPSGETVFCATGANAIGSPKLEPQRSTNLDLSYEWYFNDTGLLSVGLFKIDEDTAIVQGTVFRDDIVDSDGVVRGYDINTQTQTGLVKTTTKVNVSGGATKGVEFQYQQGFDFLPAPFDGLGVQTSYTYSSAKGGDLDYYGNELPVADNSKHSGNFVLWYDKDGFQARIAANMRSKRYEWLVNKDPYYFARYQKPTTYIDASMSYDINDKVTLSLQGINLTEQANESYLQWEDLTDERFYNERRVTLGIQVRI